jgi:hypothetical protein
MDSAPLPNVMSFSLARAYGVSPRPAPIAAPTPIAPAAPPAAEKVPTAVRRLIAASVPGKIDFSADQPRQTGSLTMYRHPADRNAAATGVELGRSLDLSV